METLSCHSNESTWAKTIKNKIYVEANVMNMIVCKVSASSPFLASEEKIFEYFFKNLPYMLPWQPIKFSDLDKIHMNHRGLLKKHFWNKKSKCLQWDSKNCQFLLSYYKSMATISCHSNQSSYLIGTKNKYYLFPLPIDAICEIW